MVAITTAGPIATRAPINRIRSRLTASGLLLVPSFMPKVAKNRDIEA